MIFLVYFAVAFFFWASLWFIAEWIITLCERRRHKKYADNHFKQTERFRRGIYE